MSVLLPVNRYLNISCVDVVEINKEASRQSMVWLLLKDDIHAKELLSFFQLIGAQTSRTVFQVGGLRGGIILTFLGAKPS